MCCWGVSLRLFGSGRTISVLLLLRRCAGGGGGDACYGSVDSGDVVSL